MEGSKTAKLAQEWKEFPRCCIMQFFCCSCVCVCPDVKSLRRLGLGYFLYLFVFSGLEYSLTFLTHQRFNYSR